MVLVPVSRVMVQNSLALSTNTVKEKSDSKSGIRVKVRERERGRVRVADHFKCTEGGREMENGTCRTIHRFE